MPHKDKEQRRAYQRRYQRERARRLRAAYFADKVCAKCGSVENLELDHIDRAQKVSHVIWSWSEERRLQELAKCQPLCQACHKAKTATEKIQWQVKALTHGSQSSYRRGCRCDVCRHGVSVIRKFQRKRGQTVVSTALKAAAACPADGSSSLSASANFR